MKNLKFKKLWLLILTILLGFLLSFSEASHAGEYLVTPDEVLIIVNDDYYDRDGNGISDSVDVGEYYASQRRIPPENICHISCTNSEWAVAQRKPSEEGSSEYGIPQIIEPLKDYLENTIVGNAPLKNKIYYIVTTLGIPVRFGSDTCPFFQIRWPGCANWTGYEIQDMYIRDKHYSGYYPDHIGSAWAGEPREGLPGSGKMDIIYHDAYWYNDKAIRFKSKEKLRREAKEEPVYLVTSLDGPTLEIAKGLVDKAIYAEKYVSPLSGNTYIDKYGLYDTSLKDCWRYFTDVTSAFEEAGVSVTQIEDIYPDASSWPGPYPRHTNRDYQSGDCPNTMYYWGWYQHWGKPRFDWKVGGMGVELESFTAFTVRSKRHAVPMMLHEGVTATLGHVDEPGLNDTFGRVLRYFALQGLDFAESAQYGTDIDWRTCRIGDPLYNLDRNADTRVNDVFPPTVYWVRVNIDKSGVHFRWNTTELTLGQVEYGETTAYGNILKDNFHIMNNDYSKPDKIYEPKHYTKRHGIDPFHTYTIANGLLPNKEYHFRIKAVDPAGNVKYSFDSTFTTGNDVTFFTETWTPEIAVWGYQPLEDCHSMAGYTVRNHFNARKFSQGGNFLRFRVQASKMKPLKIKSATVGESERKPFDQYINTGGSVYEKKTYNSSCIYTNIKDSTKKSITFNNGENELYLNRGESAWSDWVEIPVDIKKCYSISFYVDPYDYGLTSTCSGQTQAGSSTMDAVAWRYKGNVSNESDWAGLINQKTAEYEAVGDFTKYINYDFSVYGYYSIYGIDNIEVCTLNPHKTLYADFESKLTEGTAPYMVKFEDKSFGEAITGWQWDFGDGRIGSIQNPYNFYTKPGRYTVSLTVVNGSGLDTETKGKYITIYPNPDFNRDGSLGLDDHSTFISAYSECISNGTYNIEIDFNLDDKIDVADSDIFMDKFNTVPPDADIDGNGGVDWADYGAFMSIYNTCIEKGTYDKDIDFNVDSKIDASDISAFTDRWNPLPPSYVTMYSMYPRFLRISWDDNTKGEKGFRVERSADGGITFFYLCTVGANVEYCFDYPLEPEKTYYYRVYAYNDSMSLPPSGYSDIGNGTPEPPVDTFYVYPGESIQDAMDNPASREVIVYDGEYCQNVYIRKDKTLRGYNKCGSIIKGNIIFKEGQGRANVCYLTIKYPREERYELIINENYPDGYKIPIKAGITAINSAMYAHDCIIMPDPAIFGDSKYGNGVEVWNLYGSEEIKVYINGMDISNTDSAVYLYSHSKGGAITGVINYGNNLHDNNYGIVMRMHNENLVIKNNDITNSAKDGIHITYYDGNLFIDRLNNILDNNNIFDGNNRDIYCDELGREIKLQ